MHGHFTSYHRKFSLHVSHPRSKRIPWPSKPHSCHRLPGWAPQCWLIQQEHPTKQLLKGASSAQALSNTGPPSFGLHACLTGEQGNSLKLYNKPKSFKTRAKGKRGLIAKPKQHWCGTEVSSSSL